MDIISLLLILGIALVGVYTKQNWLLAIGVFLLVAYLIAESGKKQVPSGGSTGKPKIRPIVVKRKYDVESIYPSRMAVRFNPSWVTSAWWEFAQESMAAAIGNFIRIARRKEY